MLGSLTAVGSVHTEILHATEVCREKFPCDTAHDMGPRMSEAQRHFRIYRFLKMQYQDMQPIDMDRLFWMAITHQGVVKQQAERINEAMDNLERCKQDLEAAHSKIHEQAQDIVVMADCITDLNDRQQTRMQQTDLEMTQLREQVSTLTSELRVLKTNMTESDMAANRDKRQVSALTAELSVANQLHDDLAAVTAELSALKLELLEASNSHKTFDDKTLVLQDEKPLALQDDKTLVPQDDKTLVLQDDKTLVLQDDKTLVLQDDKTLALQDNSILDPQEEKNAVLVWMCVVGLVRGLVNVAVTVFLWMVSMALAASSQVKTWTQSWMACECPSDEGQVRSKANVGFGVLRLAWLVGVAVMLLSFGVTWLDLLTKDIPLSSRSTRLDNLPVRVWHNLTHAGADGVLLVEDKWIGSLKRGDDPLRRRIPVDGVGIRWRSHQVSGPVWFGDAMATYESGTSVVE
ncbi:hypothetical protein LEN26_004127, partial [Aphanomyces euteiches]